MTIPRIPLRRITIGFLRLPILGRWHARRQLRKLFPPRALHRHGYIVSKSGSGKSELIKLLFLVLKQARRFFPWKNPVETKRTFLLLDPHGDVASECARQQFLFQDFQRTNRAHAEPNLLYIAPGLMKGMYPTINPFDVQGRGFSSTDLEMVSGQLSSAFSAMISKGDVQMSYYMKTLLRPMLEVLLRIGAEKPVTFHDLARFLDGERNHDLLEYAITNNPNHEQQTFFAHQFMSPAFVQTRRSLSVRLAGLLNSRIFVELLARPRSTWHIEEALDEGKTIIVNASKSVLGSEVTEMYGRTITALVLAHVMRRKKNHRTPIFYVIDEASNFVSEDIRTILEESRKFGLHLILVNQTIRQGGMPSEFHEAVMGNTGLKVVGVAGSKTRREMALECETAVENLESLNVGHFVIKKDGMPAIRARLPKYWLGTRSTIPSEQWHQVKDDQVMRYYQNQTPSQLTGHDLLNEEIAQHQMVMPVSVSGAYLPKPPWSP